MSRVSLKSTEVENSSRIIRAILISPFRTSSCCQTSFPTIRPMLYLWWMISKMKFNSPELNCSIFFPLYCLIVSKKTDHFLRDIVRSESWFWWLIVNPFSFVDRYDSWRINRFPLLWLCFCLWSGCNDLDTCLWRLIFMWICRNFCIVVIWIDHVFVRSIRYSDPRLRIVLTHRPDSNFNSMFADLKTGCDFQYKPNSHVSLNPCFRLWSWIVSRKSVFTTSHWAILSKITSVLGHEILSHFNNTHKSCFLTESTHFAFWWKWFNSFHVLLPLNLTKHQVPLIHLDEFQILHT